MPTKRDLLSLLRYQYPVGVTTMGLCPKCGGPSRGSATCSSCLSHSLQDKGVAPEVVGEINIMLRGKQLNELRIQELIEEW